MKKITVIIVSVALIILSQGYSQTKKTEEIQIKTSAQCEMCKEKIENTLRFEKGIKFAELNLENQLITIKYSITKTNPENIKKAIAAIGYDADEIKAEKEAYEKLPLCCKKEETKE